MTRETHRLIWTICLIVAAFLLLGSIGFALTAQKIGENAGDNAAGFVRDSNLAACKKLGNPRAEQITKNGEVLKELLETARKTRLKSAAVDTGEQKQIDLDAARRYAELKMKLAPAPIADCEKVYPKP